MVQFTLEFLSKFLVLTFSGLGWLAASAATGQTVLISGPASGAAGELLEFSAQASGCTPVAGGWTWFTDGGQITGPSSTSTIQVSWTSAGSKGLSALNFNCGGAQGSATVEIFDSGRLVLSSASLSVSEPTPSVTLAVQRLGGSSGAVSVRFATTDETATGGSDYQSSSGELNWADGEVGDKLFSVTLLDDLIYEGDETFLVSLSMPLGGAQLGATRETRITLLENDPPPGDLLRFSQAEFSASEEDPFATVVVTRESALSGDISVDFATEEFTATAGEDYVTTTLTLNWPDGDTSSRSVQIPLLGDNLVEGEESLDLVLTNPSSGAFLGVPDFAVLRLLDDDAVAGSLQFSAAQQSVGEDAGTVAFQVTRSGGSNGAVSATVAIAGGSASLTDATLLTEMISWPAGDASPRLVEVAVLDDTEPESAETLELALGAATGGAVIGTQSTATLTILDNDEQASSLIRFANSTVTRSEASSSASITVLRSGELSGAASARVETRDGTAEAGLDYQALSFLLEWAPGDGSARTLNVMLLDDDLAEGDESFELVLTDLVGAELGSPSSIAIHILDDDVGLSQVSFVQSEAQVLESAGELALQVERRGDLSLAASVTVAAVAQSAATPADFSASTTQLSWDAGDDSDRTFFILLVDDQLVEGTETFVVQLRDPDNAQLGSRSQVTVNIEDDDVATSGAISFGATTYSASEGDGQLELELIRSGGSAGPAAVLLELVPREAQPNTDYVVPESLQIDWLDGEAGARNFTIDLIDDSLREPTETLQVRIRATSGAVIGSQRVATATILDDDLSGICPDLDTALCLNEQRFAVEVDWRTAQGLTGTGQPVGLTADSGYFWFFSDSNVELVIKVLDGCAINQHYWVFATGLTDVEVTLRVTDRWAGGSVVYENPGGRAFVPILDIEAFPACNQAATGAGGGAPLDEPMNLEVHRTTSLVPAPQSTPSCSAGAGADTLCLRNSRFEVQLDWQTGLASGAGQPSELTSDSGTFWFFEPSNIELVIKVLDGCAINQHYWIFAGGLTNLATELRVVDRDSGAQRQFTNSLGNAFAPILELEAFACP
jgi:hypothetical protein